jgi:hypothetical protein
MLKLEFFKAEVIGTIVVEKGLAVRSYSSGAAVIQLNQNTKREECLTAPTDTILTDKADPFYISCLIWST